MNLIRPTRPTSGNYVGRPQSLGARGSSDTSDTKNSKGNLNREKYIPTASAFSPPWPPPPAPALQCFACSCWQRVPGLAWWCGRCAVTGREIRMRSRCDRGFEEWQASPLPERTAPQPRGGEQC